MVASPTSNHQGFTNLPRRLELPTFGGIDPNGWIARVEQFFELQNTAENQKIPLAMICMEGSALHWMRWLPQTNPSMRWPMLMMELIKRYDGRHSGNELERLCSVRQTSSVDEYIDEFVELVISRLVYCELFRLFNAWLAIGYSRSSASSQPLHFNEGHGNSKTCWNRAPNYLPSSQQPLPNPAYSS